MGDRRDAGDGGVFGQFATQLTLRYQIRIVIEVQATIA